jgi:hypothetical protein
MDSRNAVRVSGPQPIKAVLFDLHCTLRDPADAADWLAAASARTQRTIPRRSAAKLVTFLDEIWTYARSHEQTGRNAAPQASAGRAVADDEDGRAPTGRLTVLPAQQWGAAQRPPSLRGPSHTAQVV